METHWFSGGFPDSVLSKDIQASRNWLRNFVQTYTDKDLPLLGMPAVPMVIRRFLTMLANYQGGIWNASNFAKSMGLTYHTMNRYLDFLEESFLVTRLCPYRHNIKKRLVKSPKVYIRDSGVLHFLTSVNNFEQLQGNVIIGNSWEGYVIEQIRELIHPDIDQPISAIEIKYTSAPKIPKGFSIAIEDLKTHDNYIITPYSDSYMKSENLRVCSLIEYLDKYIIR
jgi:predicted AAA+ superfamily ATPase